MAKKDAGKIPRPFSLYFVFAMAASPAPLIRAPMPTPAAIRSFGVCPSPRAARYDGITRFLTAVSVQLAEAEAVLDTRMLSPDSCKILPVA